MEIFGFIFYYFIYFKISFMNSKLLILLSLVFAGLLLNSYFLSQNSLEKHEKQQKRRFMLRDSEELFKVEWESFKSLA